MTEQKTEAKPAETSQQPAETQPTPPPAMGGWSVPQSRIPEPMDIARRLGEMEAKPMQPLGTLPPDADIADLLGRMMAPPEGSMMRLEQPLIDVGQPATQAPFMRPRVAQTQFTMTCPAGYVGLCLACPKFPCMALKSKVLEVASMDYRMQTMAPTMPSKA